MTIQTSSFTQGGQTSLHKLRMLRQVSGSTFKISMIGGTLTFLIHHFWSNFYLNWMMVPAHILAIVVNDLKNYMPKLNSLCFFVNIQERRLSKCDASWFLDPSQYPQKILYMMKVHATTGLYWAFGAVIVTAAIAIWYFLRKGGELKETKALSGFDLLDLKAYIKRLKSLKMKSSITVDQIPLPESAEVKHFMVAGTTGSGKTNFLNHLLKSIRDRGDRAVIVDTTGVDTTGGFVSKFYDENTDVILNPFDARGQNWNLWGEGLLEQYHFENIAECIIPDTKAADTFWVTAPRHALAEGLERILNTAKPTVQALLDILLKEDLMKTYQFFKGSEVASYFSPKSEKTALSIRSVLTSNLKVLKVLDDNNPSFSIKNWIDEESRGFLFLHCTPEQRAFMRPLLSTWLSLSIKALMVKEPDSKRRIWFIVDELASLNKLSVLETALAEIRKYGGCCVLSFQDIAQVEDIYGRMPTRALAGLTVSKVFFQASEQNNALWLSSQLGQHEVIEPNENISFGANEIRDGVNLSHHKMFKALVTPNDMQLLNPLECFIRIADTKAVLKHKLEYLNLENKTPLFVARDKPVSQAVEVEEELSNVTFLNDLTKNISEEIEKTTNDAPSDLADEFEKEVDMG